jgi:hypothetical protein
MLNVVYNGDNAYLAATAIAPHLDPHLWGLACLREDPRGELLY